MRAEKGVIVQCFPRRVVPGVTLGARMRRFAVSIISEWYSMRFGNCILSRSGFAFRNAYDTPVVMDNEMRADLTNNLRYHVGIQTPLWNDKKVNRVEIFGDKIHIRTDTWNNSELDIRSSSGKRGKYGVSFLPLDRNSETNNRNDKDENINHTPLG